MAKFNVLLTDYAWPDVSLERDILSRADAELSVAMQHDERSLARIASRGYDAIMTTWATVGRRVIDASQCRVVTRMGIGLDNIDLEHCRKREVVVTNVPDYCSVEVAEHTIALLMALARNIGVYHLDTKFGTYDLNRGPRLFRLEGRTLGIVGMGRIGACVAEKAVALGMNVLALSRSRRPHDLVRHVDDLPILLRESDFLSLHAPLTQETRGMIGAEELALMRRGAFLINTARGGLVDHAALSEAIESQRIAGAALDVQESEPPDLNVPPYNHPRVIVTPHAAFVSQQSLDDLRTQAAQQTADFLNGITPANIVP